MGFSFKGTHSDTYGIGRQIEIPARPSIKTYIVEMPNRDGGIDFTGADGNFYKEDCVFSMELQIRAASYSELRAKLKSVGEWLTGKGILMLDGDETQYSASCYEGLNYQPQLNGTFARLSINFRVAPR